jgi:hypothetical protein
MIAHSIDKQNSLCYNEIKIEKGGEKMLLCGKIDLDLETPKDVYENAKETIAYLQDVVSSIEKRILSGEEIDGFSLIPGRKTRTITPGGLEFLAKILGRERVFVSVEKPIGITELEKILDQEDVAALVTHGYIVFTEGSPRVALMKK